MSNPMERAKALSIDHSKMTFFNENGLEYTVDMQQLLSSLNYSVSVYNNQLTNTNSVDKDTRLVDQMKQQNENLRRIEDRSDIFKIKYLQNNSSIKDIIIVEICYQANLDFYTKPELIGLVTEFVLNKEGINYWHFNKTDTGECYWINTKYKKVEKTYPFLQELKNYLSEYILKGKIVYDTIPEKKEGFATSANWFLNYQSLVADISTGQNDIQKLIQSEKQRYLSQVLRKHTEERPSLAAPYVNKQIMFRARRNSVQIKQKDDKQKVEKEDLDRSYEGPGSPIKKRAQVVPKNNKIISNVYNTKGLLEPLNMKRMLKNCYQKMTSNHVADLLFYCKFDFEKNLSDKQRRAFKFQLQPNWLPILYEKWLEKKERLRLRLARELENLKNMEYDEVIYHQKYQEYMSSVYEGSKI